MQEHEFNQQFENLQEHELYRKSYKKLADGLHMCAQLLQSSLVDVVYVGILSLHKLTKYIISFHNALDEKKVNQKNNNEILMFKIKCKVRR